MEVEPMTLLIRVVASHPHAGRPEQDDEMKWAQLPALLLHLLCGSASDLLRNRHLGAIFFSPATHRLNPTWRQ